MSNLKTPGVYIDEVNAFPAGVPVVATAVPAFVGYTPEYMYQGKSQLGTPVKISSWAEFLTYFGRKDASGVTALPDGEQYAPCYQLTPVTVAALNEIGIGARMLSLQPDPATIYYLYNSLKLFFQNGGGACYIVAMGAYGAPLGVSVPVAAPLVNPRVLLADLQAGIAALKTVDEVTLVVAPDAVLLPVSDYAHYCQAALVHCEKEKSRVAILDVWGGARPGPLVWKNDIQAFREGVGNNGLSYGAAYYPFLSTTVAAGDYRNFTAPAATLRQYLPDAGSPTVAPLIAAIDTPQGKSPAQIEQALRAASPDYQRLSDTLRRVMGVLPPSGAIAGIYAMVDADRGVWQAPANVSPVGVDDVTLRLTDDDQSGLNVDAVTGKSINAIRLFTGRGVMVWGARTLDGNSQDWRYIHVRRTVIALEQAIALALRAYVFEPNTANTWMTVKSLLTNFLTDKWKQGALMGSAPNDAFSVSVGLGSTMMAEDILNGVMRVTVLVALVHPAEFVVMNFVQQMASNS